MGQCIEYVENKSVSATRNATCYHMLLLGFAAQSDTDSSQTNDATFFNSR